MVDVAKSYDEHAQEWAKRLHDGNNPAHSLLEKPAMWSALPDLLGKYILAVGCGSGEELELLINAGARESDIVGIDVSEDLSALHDAGIQKRTLKYVAWSSCKILVMISLISSIQV